MKINFKKISLIIVAITLLVSCYKITDNDLINPNVPQIADADLDLTLNSVQLRFADFYNSAESFGAQMTRMRNWSGPSYVQPAGLTPTNFNTMWGNGYYTLNNIDIMIPSALANKRNVVAGIGYALKAYIWGTMVDYFDSIPFDEALNGETSVNPNKSGGAYIYSKINTYLDSCILLMRLTTGFNTSVAYDNFYGGSVHSWIRLANTLKLKFLMQQRLVNPNVGTQITRLITVDSLINSVAFDFNFKYGNNVAAPDSRHPDYANNYRAGATPSDYLSNYFIFIVVAEKNLKTFGGSWGQNNNIVPIELDPRRRYYFFRQNLDYSNVTNQSASCQATAKPSYFSDNLIPFCLPTATGGYWGRDHGDASGTPPDGNFRSTWGLYPAGGRFDDNTGSSATAGQARIGGGAGGIGILPIWNSEFTEFLKAEYYLIINQATSARNSLGLGIIRSIAKVQGFAASRGYDLAGNINRITNFDSLYLRNRPSQTKAYVDTVLNRWNRVGTDINGLMNILQKEYYIALWGNGIEAYNNYRRTGFPSNFQLNVSSQDAPNSFIRSFYYPANYAFRNSNFTIQKTYGVGGSRVFWDPGQTILK